MSGAQIGQWSGKSRVTAIEHLRDGPIILAISLSDEVIFYRLNFRNNDPITETVPASNWDKQERNMLHSNINQI